jgi:integrase
VTLAVTSNTDGTRTAGYSGLASCGSVWACPQCAAKIATRRADELSKVMRAVDEAGGSAFLLTLTMRHERGDRLGLTRDERKRLRQKATRSLTLDECRAWLAQLDADEDARDKDLPDLCRFMIGTGLRIGEALAVAWPEIDLDEATVDVSRTLIRLTGVGLIRKSTKTETGERILTLPRFVVTMLRRRNPDGDALGPVFPDTRGGWRDPSNTRRALRDARGSDGFAWVTSHVFRRTCATILDQSSRSIADQLGHAQVSMTQNHYLGRRIANPGGAAALDAWHGQEDESHG